MQGRILTRLTDPTLTLTLSVFLGPRRLRSRPLGLVAPQDPDVYSAAYAVQGRRKVPRPPQPPIRDQTKGQTGRVHTVSPGGHGTGPDRTDPGQGLVTAASRGSRLNKAPCDMCGVRVSCTGVGGSVGRWVSGCCDWTGWRAFETFFFCMDKKKSSFGDMCFGPFSEKLKAP